MIRLYQVFGGIDVQAIGSCQWANSGQSWLAVGEGRFPDGFVSGVDGGLLEAGVGVGIFNDDNIPHFALFVYQGF